MSSLFFFAPIYFSHMLPLSAGFSFVCSASFFSPVSTGAAFFAAFSALRFAPFALAGAGLSAWALGAALDGAAFSAALAPFLFPLYAPIWPLPLGREAGAAGRGAGGRATQAANPLHLPVLAPGLKTV